METSTMELNMKEMDNTVAGGMLPDEVTSGSKEKNPVIAEIVSMARKVYEKLFFGHETLA